MVHAQLSYPISYRLCPSISLWLCFWCLMCCWYCKIISFKFFYLVPNWELLLLFFFLWCSTFCLFCRPTQITRLRELTICWVSSPMLHLYFLFKICFTFNLNKLQHLLLSTLTTTPYWLPSSAFLWTLLSTLYLCGIWIKLFRANGEPKDIRSFVAANRLTQETVGYMHLTDRKLDKKDHQRHLLRKFRRISKKCRRKIK